MSDKVAAAYHPAAKRPSLVFAEKSHRYKLDGRAITGVTTLIGGGLPKDALKFWSAKVVAEYVTDNEDRVQELRKLPRAAMVAALKEIPWEKRDTAAVRGTEVHALAERLSNGENIEVPEHLEGFVQSCVDFLDDYQPTPILVEQAVAHRAHWWAGKLDAIFELPDGRVVLVDWKTADSGIWPETAFQLAAYSHAEFYLDKDNNETPLPHIDETWAIHLTDCGYTVYPVKGDDDSYKAFRHMAYVAMLKTGTPQGRATYVLPALELPRPQEIPA